VSYHGTNSCREQIKHAKEHNQYYIWEKIIHGDADNFDSNLTIFNCGFETHVRTKVRFIYYVALIGHCPQGLATLRNDEMQSTVEMCPLKGIITYTYSAVSAFSFSQQE
jgi:hypothetical protein